MEKNKKIMVLQVLNIIAFIGMVIVNYLANALPINGLTTGEISEMYPNLFTPASITFAIWGLIYLLLALFVYHQAKGLFSNIRPRVNLVNDIGLQFIFSCLLNISWILAWHYLKPVLSLFIMIILLLTLIRIYLSINSNSWTQYSVLKVKLPFSVYLGWISVATVANVAAVLVYLDWGRWGLSEVFWTVLILIFITVLTIVFVLKNKDIAYGLVITWSLAGIIVKRLMTEPVERFIIITAMAGILLILISIIKIIKDKVQMV